MASIRDKMLNSIRGRSPSPHPNPNPNPNNINSNNSTTSNHTAASQGGESSSSKPNRLPSIVDILSRSSHNTSNQVLQNEDDNNNNPQHQQLSKDEIIAKLKKENEALQANFMNQYDILSSEISSQKQEIEKRDKENKLLKNKITSHETKLKEGIQIITALEDEKQFQKSQIVDLKNQHFQLQKDLEDSQFDKSEEAQLYKQKMVEAERKVQEVEKERDELVYKFDKVCMDRDTVKGELTKVRTELEDAKKAYRNDSGNDNTSVEITIQDQQLSSPQSVKSDTSEVRQTWRQLEEKKEQLESALSLLHETQSSLATLEHKYKALQKQFDDQLESETKSIKTIHQQEIDELKSALRSKDESIANLHERLEQYNDDLTKAEDEVDRLNKEIDEQGDYEETKQLLEEEKQLTSELTDKYDVLSATVEKLQKETDQLRVHSVDQLIGEKENEIDSLHHEVNMYRKKLEEEKNQSEMLLNIKASRIKELEEELKIAATSPQKRLNQLEAKNKSLHEALESVEKELHDAIEAQEVMEQEMQVKLEEKERQIVQSLTDDDFDFSQKFDLSTNSIGLVNDAVVSRLKARISDLEEEHSAERQKLSNEITKNVAKIAELQSEIDKQRDEVTSIEKSRKDKYLTLEKEVEEQKSSVTRLTSQLAAKQNEIKRLEKDVARHKASAEQKELDMREDLESREKDWKLEKRQLLDGKKALDNKLNEALKREESWKTEKRKLLNERRDYSNKVGLHESKDTISRKDHLQQIKFREDEWKSKEQKLLESSASLQKQIDELERSNIFGEKKLNVYKKDIALIDELKKKIAAQESELSDMKIQLESEKRRNQIAMNSIKNDGRKRSDKLKVIELNEEVDRLRSELWKTKGRDSDEMSKEKQETMKKAYTLAKDVQHKKEMSNLEEKLRLEIKSLKGKLSDRDTTITATLRTSFLQDQKIESLEKQVKTLKERIGDEDYQDNDDSEPLDIPILRPDPTCASSQASQDPQLEVQTLRRSVQNHLKTQKSLSEEVSKLRKQLTESNERNVQETAEGTVSQLTSQIEEYKTKIRERDGAIQSLVKSSITQEQQIAALREEVTDLKNVRSDDDLKVNKKNGPTWQEVERLQQEGEIFAGQIIEQDEEIENLRTLLNEAYAKSDENANLKLMIEDLREQLEMNDDGTVKLELEEEQRKRQELQIEIENLQAALGKSDNKQDMRFSRFQYELEEVEETNQKLQFEIRDLRRKLRTTQLDAERAEDLEKELMETKNILNEANKSNRLSTGGDDIDARQLKKNMQRLEEELKKTEEACKKLEQELAICREEKDKLQEEYTKKEIELKQEKIVLRSELNIAIKTREDIEAKLRACESSELALKGQIESQKTLKEIAISDKDRELALQQQRMRALQRDFDDQNDVIASLTDEVKHLRTNNMYRADAESTEIIAALSEEVKKLRNQSMSKEANEESTDIIAALTAEVKKLRNDQSDRDTDDVIAALSEEVKTLHAALKEARSHGQNDPAEIERVIRNEIDQEIQSIKKQKDFLGNENMKLQQKLEALEDGKEIKALRSQVEDAEKNRTLFEKTMISTYERKLNLMQMNKDLTIDGLRKDLAQSKESAKEVESDLLEQIRSLETVRHELEAELKAKMQHKNAKIEFLEQTLSAHEQVVRHMQDEMDQLQNGMEDVSVTRRAEQEELQGELISMQSRSTKYEREIATLKMKIDDMQIQHKNELERMQFHMEEIQMYSDDNPTIRQLAEKDKMAVNELSKQVENLREKVRSLQEENFDLREKIDRGDSRTSKNDKWRNSALQEQVQALTKRIRELEGGDEVSVRSSTSRRSSGRRIPLNPRGTGMSNRSIGGDDISTYTEATM